jgi:thioredoxin reductase (NADPH)
MPPTIMETRRGQMFPILAPAEVDRIRHFGHVQTYGAGEMLVRDGERGHGLTVILKGAVTVTRRDEREHDLAITTHLPGSFRG